MIYNTIHVLNTWVVQVFAVILQEYHIKQNKIWMSIVWELNNMSVADKVSGKEITVLQSKVLS
jgi:hypothetical protein